MFQFEFNLRCKLDNTNYPDIGGKMGIFLKNVPAIGRFGLSLSFQLFQRAVWPLSGIL